MQLGTMGDIELRLPDGSKLTVSIERLTILYDLIGTSTPLSGDGSEEGDDETDEEMSDATGSLHSPDDPAPHQLSVQGRVALLVTGDDAWKHLDEATTHSGVLHSGPTLMDVDNYSVSPSSPLTPSSASTSPPPFPGSTYFPPIAQSTAQTSHNPEPSDSWRSFVILPSAPKDHAFLTQAPSSQPTRAFLQRLNKEYRVLSSSLPGPLLLGQCRFQQALAQITDFRGYIGSGLRR